MATSSRDEELIELAAVVRAHGLRGELLLKVFNPESTLLLEIDSVLLRDKSGKVVSHEVEHARVHSDHVLLTLADVLDKDQADALRGQLVCVPRSALPALEEGEYYLVDLVGLEARDESGKPIGKVIDVVEYPASNCLAVECEDGVREVPELERYLLEVDVKGGYVRVTNLDELEPLKPAQPSGPKKGR